MHTSALLWRTGTSGVLPFLKVPEGVSAARYITWIDPYADSPEKSCRPLLRNWIAWSAHLLAYPGCVGRLPSTGQSLLQSRAPSCFAEDLHTALPQCSIPDFGKNRCSWIFGKPADTGVNGAAAILSMQPTVVTAV